MAETLTWRTPRWGIEVLTNGKGRIIGEVSHTWDRYTATIGAVQLGQYIDEASAKRAVEESLSEAPPRG